jgi:hypothetical protein
MRIFAESDSEAPLVGLLYGLRDISLQHFSGYHLALDMRIAVPKSFLAMYPALFSQNQLKETITFCNVQSGAFEAAIDVGHPPRYEPLERRENHPTTLNLVTLSSFGPTTAIRLGDIVLARSGDKGSNLNIGFFTKTSQAYSWLRTFLSTQKLIELMGDDWSDDYFVERVEFEGIWAVHFVVYGILRRGVSSSSRLDSLGKGAADWLRDRVVDVPVRILGEAKI